MAVPLTGQTLQASLKLRCDTTGAAYAIYWSQVGEEFKASGVFVANPSAAGYVTASQKFTPDAAGYGPVASVKSTGTPSFVADVTKSELRRKELAFKSGISQIAMLPFEDGVIEIGNMRKLPQWSSIPRAPTMPKAQLRKAFEDLGALYAMYWRQDGDELRVIADYENPRETQRRKALRGDGSSFVTHSRSLVLDANGSGPVAESLRSGQEVVVGFGADNVWPLCASMQRAAIAKEYSLCSVTMVPVVDEETGERGVLEYGVSTTAELNPITLDATLQMQVQSAGAAYGIYWKQEGDVARPFKTYTTPEYARELQEAGRQFSFVDLSVQTNVDVAGQSPAAQAIRTRSKVYVDDASQANDERAVVADQYGIGSLSYVPVVGGVIEYALPAPLPVPVPVPVPMSHACHTTRPRARMTHAQVRNV